MKDKRYARLITLIGTNRVGKTSKAREIIKGYKKENPKNEVITFDPQRHFEDLKDSNVLRDDLAYLSDKKDFLLVLDDYRMMLPGDQTPDDLMALLALRDEYGIDIILIVHHPDLIHQKVSYYITHYILYFANMSEEIGNSKKLMHGKRVIYMLNILEDHTRDHGKGQFPCFNYIIFGCQSQKVIHSQFYFGDLVGEDENGDPIYENMRLDKNYNSEIFKLLNQYG
jgi:hypothetical protein